MHQIKEKGKKLTRQIDGEELDSLSEKEFRVMIVKMIQNLINKMRTQLKRNDGTEQGELRNV